MSWKEFNSVGDSILLGFLHITGVVSIVLWGSINVQPRTTMIIPASTFIGTVMDEDFAADWYNWCLVVIKFAMYLSVSRNQWIDS